VTQFQYQSVAPINLYPHMKNDVIVIKTCTSTEIDTNAESKSQT